MRIFPCFDPSADGRTSDNMRNKMHNQFVSFYVRGLSLKEIDRQTAELFLFALLHHINPNKIIYLEDKTKNNQSRPALFQFASNPKSKWLVITNSFVLDKKRNNYEQLIKGFYSLGIEIINLEELKEQAEYF